MNAEIVIQSKSLLSIIHLNHFKFFNDIVNHDPTPNKKQKQQRIAVGQCLAENGMMSRIKRTGVSTVRRSLRSEYRIVVSSSSLTL